MAGRPPKPTALKVVEGNAGKRAINKQEPDPDYLQDLSAPDWLTRVPGAVQVWDELAPKLRSAKLLTEIDVQALSQLAVSLAHFRLAATKTGENLVKHKLVENDEGETVEAGEHINPWLLVQSMSFKQSNALMAQFGMTPAARTRVAINPQGDLFGNGSGSASAQSGPGRFFAK